MIPAKITKCARPLLFLSNINSKTKFSDFQYDLSENYTPRSLLNLKRLLKQLGFQHKDGFTCIKTECFLCKCNNQRSEVFLNKITGTFICPSCERTESWVSLSKFFENAKKLPKADLQNELSLKKVQKSYQTISIEDLNLIKKHPDFNSNIFGYNIPLGCFEILGAKYSKSMNSLYFPLKNYNNKVVGEKVLNLNTFEEATFPEKECSGVVSYSFLQKDISKAILVSSILDVLALCSVKLEGTTIICLPYGLKGLPQECLPIFEEFKQLILWFDYDAAGWDTTRNLARKLDEKRCLLIRPTNDHPTPHVALQKRLNLKTILQKAQLILHKSITTFDFLKQDILSELQNIEKVNGVKWTRFPILNKLLKGHRKGELTILTGPTGSGKTTFMSEYSLDLAIQGVSTLWGSFEIRNVRLATTLLRQFVGYPLNNKLNEFEYWTEKIEKLPIFFMTFHGQQSIKIVMEAIEHAQYVHDVHHVIIDNVQFMLGISATSKHLEKFWEQDAIISAFRTFATKFNVHVTLVMHPRKERDAEDLTTNSIFGSAKASQEADNVLIIQDKRLTSVRGKKFLQVAKNRYTGDLGIMPLEFDKDALSYTLKKKSSN